MLCPEIFLGYIATAFQGKGHYLDSIRNTVASHSEHAGLLVCSVITMKRLQNADIELHLMLLYTRLSLENTYSLYFKDLILSSDVGRICAD